MNYNSTTSISDLIALIREAYDQLDAHFDPYVYNPLCLYGAAAAQALIIDLLDTYSPDLFEVEEIEMVVGLHLSLIHI